ncbi:MAG TPA: hypothetical protein VMZ51_01950 [Acidimicrobiales bacterium]|nr:hypothetical protein [Acidimicrobiales bacterium]
MSAIARRRVSAALLVVLFAGACGGSDDEKASPAGEAVKGSKVEVEVGGVRSPAAGLRAQLTGLLQENVFLSGTVTDLVLQGKDPAPVAAVLEANTVAVGQTFSEVYDDAVAQRLVDLWRQKSALIVQFAQATAVGDQAGAAKAKTDLESFKTQFAALLNEANPQLPRDQIATDAGSHVNSLIGVVTAQSKKDPLALGKLKEAAAVMPRTSAVFAAGIVKQKAKAIQGSADGEGATLLATLTAALQENVYLLGTTTRTVVAGGDARKLRETLDENSEGLAHLFGSLYGDRQGQRFLRVWRSHVVALVDYAEAAAAKDAGAVQKATADLAGFRTSLGVLLEKLNQRLPRKAVAADFEGYVDALQAVVAAQAAGDPAEFERLHEAARTTPLLAEILAQAIAEQFDTRFS